MQIFSFIEHDYELLETLLNNRSSFLFFNTEKQHWPFPVLNICV